MGLCAESNQHRKFVTSLPGLGRRHRTKSANTFHCHQNISIKFAGAPADLYNVGVTQFSQFMHPDLPGKTDFFGYTDLFTFDRKYLAGAIVAKRGTPVLLTVTNLLPQRHILPVDPTVMQAPMD